MIPFLSSSGSNLFSCRSVILSITARCPSPLAVHHRPQMRLVVSGQFHLLDYLRIRRLPRSQP
ncbi:MAG: hypothetical protein LBM04_13985 [Opitutaceae bacterium]|nr:hypothetical protein [Opitutaceae bacterium]